MSTGKIVGYLLVGLLVSMFSIAVFKKMYQKDRSKLKYFQFSKKAHKITGYIILGGVIIHAYLQTRFRMFHNGWYVFISLLIMALLSMIGPRVSFLKKKWRLYHRILIIPTVLLLLYHVFL